METLRGAGAGDNVTRSAYCAARAKLCFVVRISMPARGGFCSGGDGASALGTVGRASPRVSADKEKHLASALEC